MLAGRGYNIYDRGVNCDIPRKLRHRYGANVIPLDFLVTGREPLAELHANMFWISGRKILEAARDRRAAAQPAHDLHHQFQVRAGQLHQALRPRSRRRAAAGSAVRRPRQRCRLHDALRSVPRQQRNSAMLPIYDGSRREAATGPSNASPGDHPLKGKRIYIPPMAYGSARAFASAFRAIGLEAEPTPPSDNRTRELGARYTSGDECYPAKVTVGDFMKVVEKPGDRQRNGSRSSCRPRRARAASGSTRRTCGRFWTPTGTPRSRSFRPPARTRTTGWARWPAPSCAPAGARCWRADLLQKLLLMRRPYEERRGDSEQAYEESLADLCRTLEAARPPSPACNCRRCAIAWCAAATVSASWRRGATATLPLIGIVGEIFCRLNTFSNENLVRRLEQYGAEAWLSDIVEWIWYTNSEHFRKLKLEGRLWTLEALGAWVRKRVQKHDEHVLVEPFQDDFVGREEPDIYEVLECARPYLPREGAFGEMVLNVGKVVYLAKKGAAGIIDISPFTCMNGIVCEAIYPRISRDLGGMPIRNFYFDGTQADLDRDLGVYMELARTYQKRVA